MDLTTAVLDHSLITYHKTTFIQSKLVGLQVLGEDLRLAFLSHNTPLSALLTTPPSSEISRVVYLDDDISRPRN
jgi:hypothetical protein